MAGGDGGKAGALNILVIDENPERAAVLERGLVEAGETRVSIVGSSLNLVERIQAMAPDVVIIDLENPDRDALEHMFQVSREVRRPIAMFVEQGGAPMVREAVEAGVSAYIVDGLKKERVRPIVEMAISRFQAFDQLRRERDEARTALAERKVVERAKGLLMTHRKLTEEDAYAAMRRAAMKQNRKLADIAHSILTAYQLDI